MIVSRNSSATTTVVSIDDLDRSVILSPLSAWGRSNQGQGVTGGTFSVSNTENATAVFHFPSNATTFFWRGLLRCGPALYSVCIDCTDLAQAEIVDGHARQGESTAVVTTLFSKNGLTNSSHTITITNLPDPRFGAASQITIDSFILVTQAAPLSVVSTSVFSQVVPTLTTSSTSTLSAETAGASRTNGAYWSRPKISATLSTGAIVGAASAGAFAVIGVLILSWWLLRRKHVYGKVSNIAYREKRSSTDAESPTSSTLKLSPSDEEQASMVHITLPSKDPGSPIKDPPSETYRSKYAPADFSQRPHSPNPSPSHPPNHSQSREAGPSTAPSRWEFISVPLSPTNDIGTEKEEVNAESEFDFDTPYPSSEIGTSSFLMSEPTPSVPHDEDDITRNAQAPAPSLANPSSNCTDPVSNQTQSISRGWRQIEDTQGHTSPRRT